MSTEASPTSPPLPSKQQPKDRAVLVPIPLEDDIEDDQHTDHLCIRALPLSCLLCMTCGLIVFGPMMIMLNNVINSDHPADYYTLLYLYAGVGLLIETLVVALSCLCVAERCCFQQPSQALPPPVAVKRSTSTEKKPLFTISNGDDSDESSTTTANLTNEPSRKPSM